MLFVLAPYCRRCMSSVCLQFGIVTVLCHANCHVVDVFPDGLGIDNSAASSGRFSTSCTVNVAHAFASGM